MSHRAVQWEEGMFLRPHHFLAAQNHASQLAQQSEKWDHHHDWGLRSIDLDLDALANYRLVVRSLEARLRDGTLVTVPQDRRVSEKPLKEAFQGRDTVTVYIGLPVMSPGRPNISSSASAESSARYSVDNLRIEDENTGVNPQLIKVRIPNLKLLLSTEELGGFDLVPIARLNRSDRAEATPQLDTTYIPPVLACDAWKPLQADIIEAIYDRVGKKLETIAAQVTSRNIGFDTHAQGDALIFAQLRELNEVYSLLSVAAFAEGIHPLSMYIELCRFVGQLSIFSAARRPPDLLRYNHDDLGGCFYRVKQYIDALLDIVVEPEYKERPFVGAGLRMQVALEPAWLSTAWGMYIGVQSQLSPEECMRLIEKLDMKVGSSERVDQLYRFGQAGLAFGHTPLPPRALPAAPGLIYYQINRESQSSEWDSSQRSLSLAIRLNEGLIAGNIQGQKVLSIRDGGAVTTLQFTLYVVPRERGSGDAPRGMS
jgi:type VI secretion system protein ImpJ